MDRRAWLGGTGLGLLAWLPVARGQAPASAAAGMPEQPLRIAVASRLATNWVGMQLLRRLCARAGLAVRIFPLPAGRAALDLQSGVIDGDGVRIRSFGDAHPEAIRIEPAFYNFTGHAYSLPERAVIVKDGADLQRVRVGAPLNTFWVMGLIAGLPRLFQAQTPEQLYQMMQKDRVDVVLDTRINGRRWSAVTATPLNESVALCRFELFCYLHRNHAALAPRLAAATQAMTASGELRQLTETFERAVMAVTMDHFE